MHLILLTIDWIVTWLRVRRLVVDWRCSFGRVASERERIESASSHYDKYQVYECFPSRILNIVRKLVNILISADGLVKFYVMNVMFGRACDP